MTQNWRGGVAKEATSRYLGNNIHANRYILYVNLYRQRKGAEESEIMNKVNDSHIIKPKTNVETAQSALKGVKY